MDIFFVAVGILAVVAILGLVIGIAGIVRRSVGGAISLVATIILSTILSIIYSQQVPLAKYVSTPITLFGIAIDVRVLMVVLGFIYLINAWLILSDRSAWQNLGRFNSTSLTLVPLAIAINIAVGQIVQTIKLPLYLDSIGTVLAGALLGPWIGLLTGALSNVIWTLTGLPNSGPAVSFAYVAAVIGAIAGIGGLARIFQRDSPRWVSSIVGAIFVFALTLFVLMFLNRDPDPNAFPPFPSAQSLIQNNIIVFAFAVIVGAVFGYFVIQRGGYAGATGLITGIIAAVLSAPMATLVYNGVTGAGTDLLVAAFRASGNSILESSLAQGVVSDPFDKMTSFLLVWLIIQSLPKRLLVRFPNTKTFDQGRTVAVVRQ